MEPAPNRSATGVPKRLRDPQRWASREQREAIFVRDSGRCVYCAAAVEPHAFAADHTVPWRLGGRTSIENLVVACFPCNAVKGNADAVMFANRLKRLGIGWRDRAYAATLARSAAAAAEHERVRNERAEHPYQLPNPFRCQMPGCEFEGPRGACPTHDQIS